MRLTGVSRSTLYLQRLAGLFTPPINIGPRATAWPANEVEAIIQARIAGRSDEEIKALVTRLIVARASTSDRGAA
jgi:prophage regulatory protein